ncbi:MAG: hypothetical protein CR982_07295 [Candidatus Cloacimonadota bacterium]|nr:MAG: hypothetical protein CR982_07295 [Candidatus Cloacimonadota bacterium]PIE79458.1 MAG: hypothetical protein CSA15_03130 [Candidatus Delongbacteria bacterium]
MKYNKLLLAFFILFISCSVSKKEVEEYKNSNIPLDKNYFVEVDKQFEISSGTDNLTYPAFFDVDSFGNIYFIDFKDFKVKKYNSKGIFIKEFGGRGTGPGEFTKVSSFFISNDSIYINNNYNRTVTLFTVNGKFVRKKNIKGKIPFFLKNITNSKLVGSSFDLKKYEKKLIYFTSINIYDNNIIPIKSIYKKELSFKQGDSTDPLFLYSSYVSDEKYIYVAKNSYDFYEINFYDFLGNHKGVISKSYSKKEYSEHEYFLAEKKLSRISSMKPKNRGKKYKKSINGIYIDNKKRIWVCTPKELDDKNLGLRFDIFKDNKFINTNYFEFDIDFEFNAFMHIKIINDKIYTFNVDNGSLKVYNII